MSQSKVEFELTAGKSEYEVQSSEYLGEPEERAFFVSKGGAMSLRLSSISLSSLV
jgi:hypothetical protein